MRHAVTLADWQNGIGRWTAGQRFGVLAVSAAFAGPVLNLVGHDGAAFITEALRAPVRLRT